MDNILKLGAGIIGGYLLASIIIPEGYGAFPNSNDELPAAMMIGGGGPFPYPSSHIGGKSGPHGGGVPKTGAWPSSVKQRAYAFDSFPQDPSIANESKCTPDQLDCGNSFACMYHKTMCALGIWK